jgi:hypothetical protein
MSKNGNPGSKNRNRFLAAMNIFQRPFAFPLGVVLTLVAAAATARAGVITYTYTGNHFTNPDTATDDFVSVSLTFATLLPDNFNGSVVGSLVTWSLTDQVFTLTRDNSLLDESTIITDSQGNIEFWQIDAYHALVPEIGTVYLPPTTVNDYSFPAPSGFHFNRNDVGTWESSAERSTPEPSTTAFMSLGGAILLIAMRRKHRLATQTTR